MPIRREKQEKSCLLNLQIFEICKIVPKVSKCINLSRNIEDPSLTNLQVLEIRKIVPKVAKCADLEKLSNIQNWPQTLSNMPIRREIQKKSRLLNFQIFEICKYSKFAT